ncbi:MAG: Spx/MgsR family RNA polymerase-binding regulatory protein [Acidobacteria bacterium]|jgi:arsenate reductase|nr:Spx/MgsR family RNA polymerase-binding regulatory protein [Acidobacteriota bacterium]
MNEIYFYGLPDCTTCQKALRRLDYHRVTNVKKRNIKEEPLSRAEVERLTTMLGGAENLFSRRSIKYRELGLRDKTLSDAEKLDLMTSDFTFLKRPILTAGGEAIAGFFEKEYDEFFRRK